MELFIIGVFVLSVLNLFGLYNAKRDLEEFKKKNAEDFVEKVHKSLKEEGDKLFAPSIERAKQKKSN